MDEAKLLSAVCSKRTRSNGHELEHKKFLANMWINFCTVRVTEQWNRLLREVMEPPSLEILNTHLDAFLCHLL